MGRELMVVEVDLIILLNSLGLALHTHGSGEGTDLYSCHVEMRA